MAVQIHGNLITLHTKNTTYQMGVNANGYLSHLYYGDRLYTGAALMRIGLPVRTIKYEGESTRIEIRAKKQAH